jgi:hypothetical protein
MFRFVPPALVATCAALASAAAAGAQVTTGATFDWSGRVPAGATLRVYSVDGAITVSRATGDQVEVHGERRYSHDDRWDEHHRGEGERPAGADMVFERVQDGNDVTICGYEVDEGSCSTTGVHGRSHHGHWRPTPSADFTVRVPAGVRIALGTGDGRIDVRGASSEVSASTGDGEISVNEVGGPVRASTGDGAIYVSAVAETIEARTGDGNVEVHMASPPRPQDMRFSTGDGTVTIYLPANFAGELDAHTGDGHIDSDFPLEMQGRLEGPHVRGTIGGGGPTRLLVTTGDGDVRLRKE